MLYVLCFVNVLLLEGMFEDLVFFSMNMSIFVIAWNIIFNIDLIVVIKLFLVYIEIEILLVESYT